MVTGWVVTCVLVASSRQDAAAPRAHICPNKPPPPPSFLPGCKAGCSVLCLSPCPPSRAPALMRLPNCCILTKVCCSLLGELLPGTEPAIGSRMDRQTHRLPALPPPPRAELSSARGGKLSGDPNIAAAAGRRSQNSGAAHQHEPSGALCTARAGVKQSWALPQQSRSHRQSRRWQRMGMSQGEGWCIPARTSSPKPRKRLSPGQGPPGAPVGTLGMGKGLGAMLWVSAEQHGQGSPDPCPGGGSHLKREGKLPSLLLSPVQHGQCRQEAATWDRGIQPDLCPAEGHSHCTSRGKKGICATKTQTQKEGGKPSLAECCAI